MPGAGIFQICFHTAERFTSLHCTDGAVPTFCNEFVALQHVVISKLGPVAETRLPVCLYRTNEIAYDNEAIAQGPILR